MPRPLTCPPLPCACSRRTRSEARIPLPQWAKYPGHKNLLPAAMADDLPLATGLGSSRAADFVSKPAFGREGHGLLYGDEVQIGGTVQPSADVSAFASSVAEGDHGAATISMKLVTPAPEMPTAAEGLEGLKRLAVHQASSASAGVSGLLERGNLTKPAGELDATVEMHVGPSVMQRYYNLPTLMGRKVVTSAWVVRGTRRARDRTHGHRLSSRTAANGMPPLAAAPQACPSLRVSAKTPTAQRTTTRASCLTMSSPPSCKPPKARSCRAAHTASCQ